ncbi:hypothetical protein AWH62_01595 [Maricaulis sp. W15]|nr:hypothetical protein AWH62_01595 [Maricaulis sp. W15]
MGNGFAVIVQENRSLYSAMHRHVALVGTVALAPDKALAFQHIQGPGHGRLGQVELARKVTDRMRTWLHEDRQEQRKLTRRQIGRGASHRIRRHASHHLKRCHRL